MRFTVAVAFAAAVFAASVFAGPSRVLAQDNSTVWSGVFTEEQAKRGEAAYAQGCARCHGFDLLGGEMAPALADGQFRSNWEGVPVGELFERIRVSMPADNPGGMSRQEYADVLAFMFLRGGFPVGPTELPSRTEMLQMIMFKAAKP